MCRAIITGRQVGHKKWFLDGSAGRDRSNQLYGPMDDGYPGSSGADLSRWRPVNGWKETTSGSGRLMGRVNKAGQQHKPVAKKSTEMRILMARPPHSNFYVVAPQHSK